ncbi:MAG: hypothetical protein J6R32_09825 [Bacteroidales bacterium]|nr:hypothetical protein [Bacteroidales bacterium]
MKKYLLTLVVMVALSSSPVLAHTWYNDSDANETSSYQNKTSASITFQNKSEYTMTLKIMNYWGGLYRTVVLSPYSSSTVYFNSSSSYKLKIKAVKNGSASYHDGGTFSVTCTDYEWTEGTMTFSLSSYGDGLGPRISAKEFESND